MGLLLHLSTGNDPAAPLTPHSMFSLTVPQDRPHVINNVGPSCTWIDSPRVEVTCNVPGGRVPPASLSALSA